MGKSKEFYIDKSCKLKYIFNKVQFWGYVRKGCGTQILTDIVQYEVPLLTLFSVVPFMKDLRDVLFHAPQL